LKGHLEICETATDYEDPGQWLLDRPLSDCDSVDGIKKTFSSELILHSSQRFFENAQQDMHSLLGSYLDT